MGYREAFLKDVVLLVLADVGQPDLQNRNMNTGQGICCS